MRNQVADLRQKLEDREGEVASLKAALNEEIGRRRAASAATADPPKDRETEPSSREAKARPQPAMCYKDYCPCEPPQGGPDTVICDQLEAGIDVSIEMLIAGRGMREARRQISEGDY
ncbi:hypothetical protein M9978_02460 [Sphingomonas sp. MG17]|uniref:Uncharacterized protein n=1 Tax=Sphingomonas tagetis TaxID=2949092 RepID=A0A9X2KJB1_9SPHN|nr:hypothetical protein [Sphingomonas tagetis]